MPSETYAVLEATRNWPFMYDLLSQHVVRVELAHPKELKPSPVIDCICNHMEDEKAFWGSTL